MVLFMFGVLTLNASLPVSGLHFLNVDVRVECVNMF